MKRLAIASITILLSCAYRQPALENETVPPGRFNLTDVPTVRLPVGWTQEQKLEDAAGCLAIARTENSSLSDNTKMALCWCLTEAKASKWPVYRFYEQHLASPTFTQDMKSETDKCVRQVAQQVPAK